jgi:hypothetical protein
MREADDKDERMEKTARKQSTALNLKESSTSHSTTPSTAKRMSTGSDADEGAKYPMRSCESRQKKKKGIL